LTSISLTLGTDDVNTIQFINIWGVAGVSSLILSSFAAAIAYTSSYYDLGVSSKVINKVNDGGFSSEEDLNEELIVKYDKWIDHNNDVSEFNSYLITGAVILAFDSIIYLVGGGLVGIYEMKYDPLSLLLFAVVFVFIGVLSLVIWKAESLFLILFPEDS
jgi:hypothetical protein